MKILFPLCISLLLLSGCQQLVVNDGSNGPPPRVEEKVYSDWLGLMAQILSLSDEQLQQQLKAIGKKPKAPRQLFRYALLNQQLNDRLGWIRARDSLRQLLKSTELSPADRSLLTMLQQHNQAMINAHARYSRLLEALEQGQQEQQQLAQALADSEAKSAQLAQKIRALTNLEKSMSIRRALTTDTTQDGNNE